MDSIRKSTRAYEAWLGKQVPLVDKDIDRKHEAMAADFFAFLRATFYRWAECWPSQAGALAEAPIVLAVGDLHIENFGLWRDADGRLVWGINDFDEVCPAPYTNDLVRLAVSAMLAVEGRQLTIGEDEICEAILDGYRRAIEGGSEPFVLAERHTWLHALAVRKLTDPKAFWERIDRHARKLRADEAGEIAAVLKGGLPQPCSAIRFLHRQAGLGSLGRPRVTAVARWLGGFVAREAKPAVPSTWLWATDQDAPSQTIHIGQLLSDAVRCPDPYLSMTFGWVIKRLAPDGARLELADMPPERDEERLLRAMGTEAGNVHGGLATTRARIADHLGSLSRRELRDAAHRMLEATQRDWHDWAG